jgi:hypothetical protein
MSRVKLLLPGIALAVAIGCSHKTDTGDASPQAALDEPRPAVEVAASNKPLGVSDSRPLQLPALNFEPTVTSESFTFGNDAPLDTLSDATGATSYVRGSKPNRLAPTYPDRPIPARGMNMQQVLAAVGEPATRMTGSKSEVWDYGTYRVMFTDDKVAFTQVW